MGRMHRTQIYLPDDMTQALDKLAQDQGTSRAELLREAARRFLDERRLVLPFGEDSLDGILGIAGRGDGIHEPVSAEHDRYLVEEELRSWKS